ncbi:Outer membrane lipoprotein-sorting protein [Tissierella praeacuta DSM 18095]|uniref:Outer membrane lipoprotein-sorting protein n=2 Tax=Tissierella praeacuta TaxID=43131 RepID=A0A1M4V8E5_9FIRM|nr:Outer membrane lipoprotein-sorting protein [Tissierella praeacuta DSM 18095]SUP03024.1 Outer membrane lipoprotein-sorting protein [Tissierella praeacuta]
MILKRLLLFILITMVLLTSCKFSYNNKLPYKDKRVLSRIEKTYENCNGYKCKANVKIISEETESIYLIEETYTKPNKYRLEILKPKESKGIIILNTDDKIFVEHPSIKQSISLITIKSLNKQMLMGGFYEKLSNANKINTEKINGEEYLTFEFKLEERNKYRDSAKVLIKKKGFTPYRLSIFDESGGLHVEITYENFKFTKRLKKKL